MGVEPETAAHRLRAFEDVEDPGRSWRAPDYSDEWQKGFKVYYVCMAGAAH